MEHDPYLDRMFRRLDQWRHLPAYRLEPRADALFGAFMPEILEFGLRASLRSPLIPEFPLRRGYLYGESTAGSNASVKVDYLAAAADADLLYLVELKTDLASRREVQDDYLTLAKRIGVAKAVEGVLAIVKATNGEYWPKYLHLLARLEGLGLVQLPSAIGLDACTGKNPVLREWFDGVRPDPRAERSRFEIVYLQPEQASGNMCITFATAAQAVRSTGAPLGQRFAEYLERWVSPAGAALPAWDG